MPWLRTSTGVLLGWARPPAYRKPGPTDGGVRARTAQQRPPVMGGQTTGVPAVDAIVVWSVAAVAIASAAGVAWKLRRSWRRMEKGVEEFVADWRGTPARPGVRARPGMMGRMSTLEEVTQQVDRRLRAVEHELRPNNGRSMRDAIDRLDRAIAGGLADDE